MNTVNKFRNFHIENCWLWKSFPKIVQKFLDKNVDVLIPTIQALWSRGKNLEKYSVWSAFFLIQKLSSFNRRFTNFDKTAEIATSCASQYFNAAAIKTLHKPKYAIGYPSGNLVSRVYSFSWTQSTLPRLTERHICTGFYQLD